MLSKLYIFLLKLVGNCLNVITGDTLVADRHIWVSKSLPETNNNENFLDIGCGSGAFTFLAARRGYRALGFSWDKKIRRKLS